YLGIIHSYNARNVKHSEVHCIDVNTDRSDPRRRSTIERLCRHNLLMARAALETWSIKGGRLSDIDEDEVLERLAQHHLAGRAAFVLPRLAAIAQFDLPLHEAFLNRVTYDEREELRLKQLLR